MGRHASLSNEGAVLLCKSLGEAEHHLDYFLPGADTRHTSCGRCACGDLVEDCSEVLGAWGALVLVAICRQAKKCKTATLWPAIL